MKRLQTLIAMICLPFAAAALVYGLFMHDWIEVSLTVVLLTLAAHSLVPLYQTTDRGGADRG